MSAPVDPKLLEILVCPLTKGPLRYDAERQELVSEKAKLAYPIRDGIPIMLVDAGSLGLDLGARTSLEAYERARRFDNTLMIALTDGLNRLFSNAVEPIKLARDAGLAAVNCATPLKRAFMRHAMGL